MPTTENDDNDDGDFTKINKDGDSEHGNTPPPELTAIKAPTNLPHHIFEPPSQPLPQPSSRDVSMVTMAPQTQQTGKAKSLFFWCLFCCRPSGSIRPPVEESKRNKKGLKYENS